MCERKSDKMEREWRDRIPREDECAPDPGERTYRDGSTVHECWDEKTGMGAKIREKAERDDQE